MAKINLVIFDLDNTLVITKPAAKVGYKQAIYHLAKLHGLDKQKDKLYNHWKRIVQGMMGESKPHLRRFAHSLQTLMAEHKIPDTYYTQALNLYEKEMLSHLAAQNGAKELLSWLKNNHLEVAVATGSDRSEAIKKLKACNLYQYIDLLVTPNETHAMQPDPIYYDLILKELKVKPAHVLVVGDNQKEDLDPAKSLKLKTYLLPPAQTNLVSVKSIISESL